MVMFLRWCGCVFVVVFGAVFVVVSCNIGVILEWCFCGHVLVVWCSVGGVVFLW